jgi:hypothetical protein
MLKIIKDNITKKKEGQYNMKNYQSTTEGSWIEFIPVQLTEEQKTIMSSTSIEPEDIQTRKALIEEIKSLRETTITSGKSTELQSFYESKKPEVGEGQTYSFIAMDVSEGDGGNFTGILNCRVNGEHIQVRF